jgi:hypothetical protein
MNECAAEHILYAAVLGQKRHAEPGERGSAQHLARIEPAWLACSASRTHSSTSSSNFSRPSSMVNCFYSSSSRAKASPPKKREGT